ncbi:hypothetical protein BGZ98_006564, partial [Dissophora globulifera]
LNPGNLFEFEPTWNQFNWFKFERYPEAFTGKREDWKTFSNHLALYFKAHESLYTSSMDKILFAISRLGSGPAFKYMQTYIPSLQKPPAERPGIITNYDLFIKTMAEHFGQQNAHLVAE